MKVLLDEKINVRFRHHLPGHDVFTVQFMGWKALSNGALIARAALDGFEVLVTTDRSIQHQQNVATLPLSLATLYAPTNAIDDLIPLAPKLLAELANVPLPKLIHVHP